MKCFMTPSVPFAERRIIIMYTENMNEVKNEINKINNYMQNQLWMDFEFCMLDAGKIVLSGTLDRSYNKYVIDIEFEQPYCISSLLYWSVDTSIPLLELANEDEIIEMNKKYRVEQGNYIFKINVEDFEQTPIYIAARNIKCVINDKESIE